MPRRRNRHITDETLNPKATDLTEAINDADTVHNQRGGLQATRWDDLRKSSQQGPSQEQTVDPYIVLRYGERVRLSELDSRKDDPEK